MRKFFHAKSMVLKAGMLTPLLVTWMMQRSWCGGEGGQMVFVLVQVLAQAMISWRLGTVTFCRFGTGTIIEPTYRRLLWQHFSSIFELISSGSAWKF